MSDPISRLAADELRRHHALGEQLVTMQTGEQVAAQLAAEAQARVRIPSQEDAVVWRQTP